MRLHDFLRGQVRVLGLDLGAYRIFLIGVVVLITIVLHLLLVKTRFGAQVRASVDNAVASAVLGIDVNRVFGVGAYAAGLLAVQGWGEPLSGLVVAGAAGALVGYATSFLVVRGSDLARLMVTLGIGLMLFEAANQAAFLTGGADGLSGVTMGKLFGVFAFDLRGSTAYLYSLAVLFLLFVMARRIVNSPFGLSLRGVRENVTRMPAIGAPVTRRLVAIYTVSATMAGVAGGLLAQTTQFVGLDVFGFPRSADLMIMLVLGGAGRLYGGLVGTAVFMLAHHYLSDLNPIYWQFWLGLLLVVVVLYGRGGILGALDGLRARIGRRRST